MPLMTNPSRRSRGPRLRNRSLPRLRLSRSPQPRQHAQPPQHVGLEEEFEEFETVEVRGPTKMRRRSYSLPKRLVVAKLSREDTALESKDNILNDSSSSEVEVSLKQHNQKNKVSFGDAIVEEKFESPFGNQEDLEFDPTQVWYNESDYVRFQKDRILTSFDYQASITGKHNFDHDTHAIRGLELVIHPKYSQRLKWEKKDLWKALQKEEAHQKETGKFPNLERFKVVSQRHTKDAKNRASSLGQEDAKDVNDAKVGKSWFGIFAAPPSRGVQRHRSMDCDL